MIFEIGTQPIHLDNSMTTITFFGALYDYPLTDDEMFCLTNHKAWLSYQRGLEILNYNGFLRWVGWR